MLKKLWNNEAGFVISAELALVLTIAVIGIIVGLSHVAVAVNQELTDVSKAIGSLNQSFSFTGFKCCPCTATTSTSATNGSVFHDFPDICDGALCAADVVTCAGVAECDVTGGAP